MRRSFHWIRSTIAATAAVAALALAPTSALALGDASVTVVGSGSANAGELRTYTATVANLPGTPDPWTQGGTVTITPMAGMPISALAIDPTSTMDATVTGATTLRIEPGSVDGEELRVTFSVRLRLSDFDGGVYLEVSAMSDDDGTEWGWSGGDVVNVLPVGGPSLVLAQVGPVVPSVGVTDRWAHLGATAASTLTVRNVGAGVARYVVVDVAAQTAARREYSPEGPAPATPFAPVVTLGTGTDCVPVSPGSTTCEIATLPAGGAVSVPLTIGGIDHYGVFTVTPTVKSKGDRGNPYVTAGWLGNDYFSTRASESVDVTDGTTVDAVVAVSGPALGAGNTDIAYTSDIANPGPDTANNAIVRVTASTFTTAGALVDGFNVFGVAAAPKLVGDPSLVQSLRRVELSNGTACANSFQRIQDAQGAWTDVRLVDTWDCPVGAMAAGSRITAKITANFATTRVSDMRGLGGTQGVVGTELLTTSYVRAALPFNAGYFGFGELGQVRAADAVYTGLNTTNTIDLDVAVASPRTIGAQRLATQRVSIRNAGATPATQVSLVGGVTSRAGNVEPSLVATRCVLGGIDDSPMTAMRCFIGDLAPGATTTVDVPILAGTTLGSLTTSYSAVAREVDSARANDDATFSMDVVAPTAVPLDGVAITPPRSTPMAAFLARGYATKVDVPANVGVRVDLKVSPAVAYALKLRTKRGVKSDLVIGTASRRTTKDGVVVVTVKVRRQYIAKLRASTRRVAIKRTTTVVSTARFTAGSRTAKTQTIKLTPVRRKR